MNRHLWFHSSGINDTSNNILLYRCKIYKLDEENGSIIEMHKNKKSLGSKHMAGSRPGRWGHPGGSSHCGCLEQPGAQAPSSTPNSDDSVIIISFGYSLP